MIQRLAAEFQGFARDLHDDAVEEAHARMAGWNRPWADAVRWQLRRGRDLDRRNATPSTLSEDFSRLGLDPWSTLRSRDVRTKQRLHHLEHLNQARNAIAHDDAARLQRLALAGVRLNLATFRRWRAAAGQIACGVDAVVAEHLAATFNTPVPW